MSLQYVRERLGFPLFWLELRRLIRESRTVEDHLDVALEFRYHSWSIRATQVRSEIRELLQTLERNPPHSLLEIGTYRGGSLYLFSRVSAADGLLMTMDLPVRHSPLRRLVLSSFRGRKQRIVLLSGNSQQPAMRERVRAHLGHESLDFLFIDGDHSYRGIKQDFELYQPLVRSGGLVAFHDIVPGPESRVGGVPSFWSEVKDRFPARELVEDWSQGGFGIGLLRMP